MILAYCYFVTKKIQIDNFVHRAKELKTLTINDTNIPHVRISKYAMSVSITSSICNAFNNDDQLQVFYHSITFLNIIESYADITSKYLVHAIRLDLRANVSITFLRIPLVTIEQIAIPNVTMRHHYCKLNSFTVYIFYTFYKQRISRQTYDETKIWLRILNLKKNFLNNAAFSDLFRKLLNFMSYIKKHRVKI